MLSGEWRLTSGEQWNYEMVIQMRGLPWEPVPGKRGMHIPVDVDDQGDDPEGDRGRDVRPTGALEDEDPVELRGGLDKLHISRKATIKFGHIVGCAGCNELLRSVHVNHKVCISTARTRKFPGEIRSIRNIYIIKKIAPKTLEVLAAGL